MIRYLVFNLLMIMKNNQMAWMMITCFKFKKKMPKYLTEVFSRFLSQEKVDQMVHPNQADHLELSQMDKRQKMEMMWKIKKRKTQKKCLLVYKI